jgi:hypothetical protein
MANHPTYINPYVQTGLNSAGSTWAVQPGQTLNSAAAPRPMPGNAPPVGNQPGLLQGMLNPQNAAMLQMASSLLKSRAPSLNPGNASFGGAVGNAMQAGMQGYNQAQQQQMQRKNQGMQQQLMQQQIDAGKAGAAQAAQNKMMVGALRKLPKYKEIANLPDSDFMAGVKARQDPMYGKVKMGQGDYISDFTGAATTPPKPKAPEHYEWAGDNLVPVSGGKYDPQSPENRDKRVTPLRNEFVKASGEFIKVRDAYGTVAAASADPSPAGDLALIFAYMKMLDPGSTVREGEFANAQNSGGVPDRVKAMYNNVISGERLSKNIRDDFVDRSGRLYKQRENTQDKNISEFERLAKASDVNPKRVIIDLSAAFDAPLPSVMKDKSGNEWE